MVNLRDIYYKVGKKLYESDFDCKTTDEKKVLVDTKLKNYLVEKIAEGSNGNNLDLSNNTDVSIEDLVILLGDLIPKKDHFDTMRHLTHFILNIAGEMQGWSITWWEEPDIAYVNNPFAEFNKAGKWESLKTHKETSYVQTFQFVHEIYKENFMEKSPKNKQLTLQDIKGLKSNE